MAKHMRGLSEQDFRAVPGVKIRLSQIDPGFTDGFKNKRGAQKKLEDDRLRLCDLQDIFYASQRYALLIIFQGMDASGKDGAIKHVMSGVNPQGVDVYQFKQPTAEEVDHDFLWRCERVLPQRGRFGIFNRSYYEEVLIVKVHPKLLQAEAIARGTHGDIWDERYEDINAFERHLVRNGTRILKFFLHISKEEQRRRFLERIEMPQKNWKVSPADLSERSYWNDYMQAYEKAINHTSTEYAAWHIIPSDHKWFARTAIGDIIVAHLKDLKLSYPKVTKAQRAALRDVRRILERER